MSGINNAEILQLSINDEITNYMNEFDIKAATWDYDPMHISRSEAIAKEIVDSLPPQKNMKALVYGAGTGIIGFLLHDHFKEVILMDNSQEMIRITNEKISRSKVKNIRTVNFNLEDSDYKDGKFDLILTEMVLHHIDDTQLILRKFHDLINPGKYLVIADITEEDGSFHGEGFTGHNGFNIEALSSMLTDIGYSDINHRICFVIDRKISETESKKFEVFLLTAKKLNKI